MHILNLPISATVHAVIQLQFYPDAERVIRMRSRHYDSAYILSTVSLLI
jgi:hypothetical protein